MFRVTHLIPYDGIGGVETAARSMAGHSAPDIRFRRHYIYDLPDTPRKRRALFSPWPPLRSALWLRAEAPDLVIVSLWRSCIAALLAKLLLPRLRLVLFLHSNRDWHWLDRMLTRLVAAAAVEIWADSEQTSRQRLARPADRVISFVTERFPPADRPRLAPSFVFWGRLHRQKNIPLSLEIFARVCRDFPEARYVIVGPDGGDRARIEEIISRLGLAGAVELTGPTDHTVIVQHAHRAAFYLQTSIDEGMAMSVVEAMQMGLIPVVTLAGEIARYCQHGENAIIVTDAETTASILKATISDPDAMTRMRDRAISTWSEHCLYADDVSRACAQLAGALR